MASVSSLPQFFSPVSQSSSSLCIRCHSPCKIFRNPKSERLSLPSHLRHRLPLNTDHRTRSFTLRSALGDAPIVDPPLSPPPPSSSDTTDGTPNSELIASLKLKLLVTRFIMDYPLKGFFFFTNLNNNMLGIPFK